MFLNLFSGALVGVGGSDFNWSEVLFYVLRCVPWLIRRRRIKAVDSRNENRKEHKMTNKANKACMIYNIKMIDTSKETKRSRQWSPR